MGTTSVTQRITTSATTANATCPGLPRLSGMGSSSSARKTAAAAASFKAVRLSSRNRTLDSSC